MTTDPTLLQERIARALTHHWQRKHSTRLQSGPCSGCSRVAAVAASVHAAQEGQERARADGDFTAAARAEADRRMRRHGPVTEAAMVKAHGFIDGTGWARTYLAEQLKEAEAAMARVRDLHRDDGTGDCTECDGIMGRSWPCPTILALNGED